MGGEIMRLRVPARVDVLIRGGQAGPHPLALLTRRPRRTVPVCGPPGHTARMTVTPNTAPDTSTAPVCPDGKRGDT
jgi:hypothetical protein